MGFFVNLLKSARGLKIEPKGELESNTVLDALYELDEDLLGVQNQLNQAISEGDQLAETQQARVSNDGTTYTTLKERLDSMGTVVVGDSPPVNETAMWIDTTE